MLNLLSLIVGLSIATVHCHDWAMVCMGNRDVTNSCQRNARYFCTARGYISYPEGGAIEACDEVCTCINLLPKLSCMAWIGSGSMGCIRGENRIDPSTLFEISDGHQDEATTYILRAIHLQVLQLQGRGHSSLEEDEDNGMDFLDGFEGEISST